MDVASVIIISNRYTVFKCANAKGLMNEFIRANLISLSLDNIWLPIFSAVDLTICFSDGEVNDHVNAKIISG